MAEGSSPLTRGKLRRLSAAVAREGLIPAHAGKTTLLQCRQDRRGAHPRSRGENGAGRRGGGCQVGSSPLTRGKPARFDTFHAPHGLIPAHAGKTCMTPVTMGASAAHPRSRGENYINAWCWRRGGGSSPLTRGKLQSVAGQAETRGLIPAHAGKTSEAMRRSCLIWAHPRSRGENTS